MRIFIVLGDPPSPGQTNVKPYDEVAAGARRLGPVTIGMPDRDAGPDDVLICWSPFLGTDRLAALRTIKAVGGRAIVMENGWLSPIGPRRFFQVALDGWNGEGRFPPGGPDRWRGWGVPMLDWRRDGSHVLVIGQKLKGADQDFRRMPEGWDYSLTLPTRRPVVRRTRKTAVSLDEQLRDAWCTVTWTSTAAVKGLIAGVPAFYCGPTLICHELCRRGTDVDHPAYPEREPVFERLAWCQWTREEIATGEPFARLLDLPHDRVPQAIAEPFTLPAAVTQRGLLREQLDHARRRWRRRLARWKS